MKLNLPLSKQHGRLSGQDLLSVAQQPVAARRRGQMPQRREPKGIHKQRPDAVIHKHLRQQQNRRRLDKRRPRPRILAQIRPSRAAEESRGQHQLERHGFRGSVAPCLCVCVCLLGQLVVRWKLVPRHPKGKMVCRHRTKAL